MVRDGLHGERQFMRRFFTDPPIHGSVDRFEPKIQKAGSKNQWPPAIHERAFPRQEKKQGYYSVPPWLEAEEQKVHHMHSLILLCYLLVLF